MSDHYQTPARRDKISEAETQMTQRKNSVAKAPDCEVPMPKDQLRDFFQEKKQKAKPANIDWAAKRDAWVKAVEALYRRIEEEYLKAAKDQVEIRRQDKVVSENFVGEYHI